MKRSAAVGHLVEIGEVSSERLRLRGTDIGWPLEELRVTGDLLGLADTVDAGVVLVVDVPPDEAPWLAINPAGGWAGDQLRLRKRPASLVLPAARVAGVEPQAPPAGAVLVGRGRSGTTPSSTRCGPDGSTSSTSWSPLQTSSATRCGMSSPSPANTCGR